MQAYSNPARSNDPHALPDVEVFHADGSDIFECGFTGRCDNCKEQCNLADGFGSEQQLCLKCAKEQYGSGWYWWTCLPGCMPDSDPVGPFATQQEALADAQQDADDDSCKSENCANGNCSECPDADGNCCDCNCHLDA